MVVGGGTRGVKGAERVVIFFILLHLHNANIIYISYLSYIYKIYIIQVLNHLSGSQKFGMSRNLAIFETIYVRVQVFYTGILRRILNRLIKVKQTML